jgi:hypothetical protein
MLSRCFVTALVVLLLVGVCMANDSQSAKTLADEVTGLNRLTGVSIEVESFTLPEDDDTPIRLFKEHLVNGSLWKISYTVDALRHENGVNPHIVGFDVYVDVSLGRVLKIVSRDAEGLPQQFRKGIEVSNKHIRSMFKRNYRVENALPTVTPTFKLADFLAGKGVKCRHYECYYILYRGHNSNTVVPKWMVIRYGTEPHPPLGPIATRPRTLRTLADGYLRTFEIHFVDAMSGEWSPYAFITGENSDTFK